MEFGFRRPSSMKSPWKMKGTRGCWHIGEGRLLRGNEENGRQRCTVTAQGWFNHRVRRCATWHFMRLCTRCVHARTRLAAVPVGARAAIGGLAEGVKQQRAPPTGSILASLSFVGSPSFPFLPPVNALLRRPCFCPRMDANGTIHCLHS